MLLAENNQILFVFAQLNRARSHWPRGHMASTLKLFFFLLFWMYKRETSKNATEILSDQVNMWPPWNTLSHHGLSTFHLCRLIEIHPLRKISIRFPSLNRYPAKAVEVWWWHLKATEIRLIARTKIDAATLDYSVALADVTLTLSCAWPTHHPALTITAILEKARLAWLVAEIITRTSTSRSDLLSLPSRSECTGNSPFYSSVLS